MDDQKPPSSLSGHYSTFKAAVADMPGWGKKVTGICVCTETKRLQKQEGGMEGWREGVGGLNGKKHVQHPWTATGERMVPQERRCFRWVCTWNTDTQPQQPPLHTHIHTAKPPFCFFCFFWTMHNRKTSADTTPCSADKTQYHHFPQSWVGDTRSGRVKFLLCKRTLSSNLNFPLLNFFAVLNMQHTLLSANTQRG